MTIIDYHLRANMAVQTIPHHDSSNCKNVFVCKEMKHEPESDTGNSCAPPNFLIYRSNKYLNLCQRLSSA